MCARNVLALLLVAGLLLPFPAAAQSVAGSVNLRALGGTDLSGANVIDPPTSAVRSLLVGSSSTSPIAVTVGPIQITGGGFPGSVAVQPPFTAASGQESSLVVTLSPFSAPPVGLIVGQGSNTSGQLGPLMQGAVTTSSPTYVGSTTSPLSLDTAGNLRVLLGTGTATIGSLTANQSVNLNQLGGTGLSGANVVDTTNTAFRVNCVTGCTAGASFTDNSAFTAGTTTESNIGGVYNDTLASVTSGNAAAVRITTARALHANLRNASGTELGTALNPLVVTSAPSVLQGLVSGTAPIASDGTTQTISLTSLGAVRADVSNSVGVLIAGLAASGATPIGNPVKIGGVFNTTQPTVTTGQAVDVQATARGALIVGTGADAFNVTVNAALPTGANTIGAVTQASGPWTANVTQFGSTNISTGTGASGAGIPRVTISNDSSLAANQSVNVAQINGVAPTMGNGVSGTGVQRVTIASDSTGQVALAAGSNTIGALTANQSVNVAQINGVTTLTGNGTTGTGSQRVTIASDNTAFAVNATLQTGSNVIGALTANQSMNLAQVAGAAVSTAASGTQKVGVTGNAGAAMDAAGQNAASPANELLIAGQFNTTPTTISTGNISPVQLDSAANLLVNLKTALPTGSNIIGALSANQSVNVAQFGGTNVVTGTGASGSGVPRVTVSSDSQVRPIDSAGADLTSAKGTQTSRFVGVQSVTDAGRTRVLFTADAVAVATTEGVVTFVKDVGGTATTGQTSYTVTSGKTLRVQSITASLADTSTTGDRARVRLREGASCGTSSTMVWTVDLIANVSGTLTAPEGGALVSAAIPDGLEFPASTVICFSEIATTNTTANLSLSVVGYEY